jgi:hypothetical protein
MLSFCMGSQNYSSPYTILVSLFLWILCLSYFGVNLPSAGHSLGWTKASLHLMSSSFSLVSLKTPNSDWSVAQVIRVQPSRSPWFRGPVLPKQNIKAKQSKTLQTLLFLRVSISGREQRSAGYATVFLGHSLGVEGNHNKIKTYLKAS